MLFVEETITRTHSIPAKPSTKPTEHPRTLKNWQLWRTVGFFSVPANSLGKSSWNLVNAGNSWNKALVCFSFCCEIRWRSSMVQMSLLLTGLKSTAQSLTKIRSVLRLITPLFSGNPLRFISAIFDLVERDYTILSIHQHSEEPSTQNVWLIHDSSRKKANEYTNVRVFIRRRLSPSFFDTPRNLAYEWNVVISVHPWLFLESERELEVACWSLGMRVWMCSCVYVCTYVHGCWLGFGSSLGPCSSSVPWQSLSNELIMTGNW